jgi:hypothetical protein
VCLGPLALAQNARHLLLEAFGFAGTTVRTNAFEFFGLSPRSAMRIGGDLEKHANLKAQWLTRRLG